MGAHNEFGKLGEEMAAKYLIENGYTIRYKNYRYLKAEIDILAQKDSILAVVEVKSRSSDYLQEISETVNKKKIGLLVMAADHYVIENDLDVEVRFDIITILKKGKEFKLEHLKDAFFYF
jgi:putative endonuclease